MNKFIIAILASMALSIVAFADDAAAPAGDAPAATETHEKMETKTEHKMDGKKSHKKMKHEKKMKKDADAAKMDTKTEEHHEEAAH